MGLLLVPALVALSVGGDPGAAAPVRTAAATSGVDDLWHLDETSGTTMTDSGLTPHPGALHNVSLGQAGDPAFPGTSYAFNGTSSYVDVGTADELNAGSQDLRIAFSLNTTTVPPSGSHYNLFRKGQYPGTEYKLELEPNGQFSCELRTLQADGTTLKGYTIQPAIDLHDGTWHRLTCSKVGGTMTVTVDGATFSKSITGSISNTYHLILGSYSPSSSSDYYQGRLDEVSFRVGSPQPDAPPSVPAGVTATAVSAGEVDLAWSASTDTDGTGVAGYVVSRDGTVVATVGAATTGYRDTTVNASSTYSYTVTAFDTVNNFSAASDPATVTTPEPQAESPPTVPAGVSATAVSSGEVDLAWSASTDTDGTGVAGYVVSRDGSTLATLGASATNYRDTTVTASTTYSYTVTAFDTAGNYSAASDPATATTPDPQPDGPPSVPAGVTATAVSSAEVDLAWSASTDTDGTGVAGYVVNRGGTTLATLGASATSYRDTTVTAGTTYSYTVTAFDTAGNYSAASGPATVTTPPAPTGVVDDLWHLDETSGTTMVDSGSTPHPGVLHNVALSQAGDPAFPGTSYGFNGTTSFVDVGTADDLNAGSKDVRIALSLNTTTVPAKPDYDLFRKGQYPGTEYKLELQPNGQFSCEFRTLQADGSTVKGYTIQPAIDLHDGKWHRLTCSKVGGTMTVTVDGKAFTKSITGSISNPYHVIVGAYSASGGGDFYQGRLDEISFRIG